MARSEIDREKKGIILLEGKRLIREAVNAGLAFRSIYFTHAKHVIGLPLQQLADSGSLLYKVTDAHMKVWSSAVTPPGIMGKFLFSACAILCLQILLFTQDYLLICN